MLTSPTQQRLSDAGNGDLERRRAPRAVTRTWAGRVVVGVGGPIGEKHRIAAERAGSYLAAEGQARFNRGPLDDLPVVIQLMTRRATILAGAAA
jgi:hypothetical protein